MDKKILIACPIHSREWILSTYLKRIYNLDYDKKLIDIYWIGNNIIDNSWKILQKFKTNHENEYNSITLEIHEPEVLFIDDRDCPVKITFQNGTVKLVSDGLPIRIQHTYALLSILRNKILDKCVELNCDFLLSVDSDILIPSNLLKDLLFMDKDICSSLIYNGYLKTELENAYQFSNVLKKEKKDYIPIINYYIKNPIQTPKDKLINCDLTGACCLIRKKVCASTYYQSHILGEDAGWSENCKKAGYEMYCAPFVYSQHIMSEDFLPIFQSFGEIQ